MKSLLLFVLFLFLTACDSGNSGTASALTASPVSIPDSSPASQVIPSSTPAPNASPSPVPSPTIEAYNATADGLGVCSAFAVWNSETTTIEAQYNGYYYSFASTGVTATFQTGPDNGQTQQVLDPVTIDFGGNPGSPDCVV